MPLSAHPFKNEDVMAYLDGELSASDAAEMTAHLSQCRTCQDIAADLQGVLRQLSGWAVSASDADGGIPPNIATALSLSAASGHEQKPSAWTWHFVVSHRWAFATVAILAVLFPITFRSTRPLGTNLKPYASEATSIIEPSAPPLPAPKHVSAVPDTVVQAVRAQRFANSALIVQTAEIRMTAYRFDTVRADLDRVIGQFGGHIGQLNVSSPSGAARSLTASLRIPSGQMEAAIAELRRLGHVDGESQSGEEVTQQSIDLEARLSNARHTEARLTQILGTRTGKLSDVLEVEQKLSEVRGEIERAEAEQKSLNNRISFAAVSLQVAEDYRAPLVETAPSIGTRLSNAAVDGLLAAYNGIIGLGQVLLTLGPSVILWSFLLGLPAYFLWKKLRH